VSVMLSDDSRRDSRMVSNAAVRSRRMRMFRLPESEERRRSFVIFRRAVSVLCFDRKLDMMSGVSPGLLRMGVTAASLREGGTDPDLREEFMMVAMSWEMAGRLSLTHLEGIGSSVQVELMPVMKWDSCMGSQGRSGTGAVR